MKTAILFLLFCPTAIAQVLQVETYDVSEIVGADSVVVFDSQVLAIGRPQGMLAAVMVDAVTQLPPDCVTFEAEQKNWTVVPFDRDGNRIVIKTPGQTRVRVEASGELDGKYVRSVKTIVVTLDSAVRTLAGRPKPSMPIVRSPVIDKYSAAKQLASKLAGELDPSMRTTIIALYRSTADALASDPDGPVNPTTKRLNEAIGVYPDWKTRFHTPIYQFMMKNHWKAGMTGKDLGPFYRAIAKSLEPL